MAYPSAALNQSIRRRWRLLVNMGVLVLMFTSVDAAERQPPPMPRELPAAWVNAETIDLWPGAPPGAAGYAAQTLPADWPVVFIRNTERPALHVFKPAKPNGKAVLVIPGGAYQFVSIANEGVDVAAKMNATGITVFVLTYRLPGEGWDRRTDVPLQDAQRAMRVIRARAAQYGIDADALAVIGFSAGGHLAATLATRYRDDVYTPVDLIDVQSTRPIGVGLIYPVVTMDARWTHELSRDLLLGKPATDDAVAYASAEQHISADTPPIFIVHAMDDKAVPVENSLHLIDALRVAGRPVEAHLLQEGGHAFGVGWPDSSGAFWIDQFNAWWQALEVPSPAAAGIVDEPCPAPLLPPPAFTKRVSDMFLEPGTVTAEDFSALGRDPAIADFNKLNRERAAQDWPGLCRYRAANKDVIASGKQVRVVFMGDSITENWALADPSFFSNGIIGRGISAQTTAQMVLRFHSDVIELKPQAVQIMAGTNDIAGNTGPQRLQDVQNNIMAMAEMARSNGIKVMLASIPPAAAFPWQQAIDPRPFIKTLNAWLQSYAREQGFEYVDYYASLAGANNELRADIGNDGVHPNRRGYAIMRGIAEQTFRN
ncbi:MAG: alpha/beta hydrolase fold domain-containing protein [Gammaproteobacteria bacterium]|nr:alpha/beta hydrolase fold domain-containing protein [Gammaproteobacteria bacterium]